MLVLWSCDTDCNISVLMWHIVLETLNASEQVLLDIFGE